MASRFLRGGPNKGARRVACWPGLPLRGNSVSRHARIDSRALSIVVSCALPTVFKRAHRHPINSSASASVNRHAPSAASRPTRANALRQRRCNCVCVPLLSCPPKALIISEECASNFASSSIISKWQTSSRANELRGQQPASAAMHLSSTIERSASLLQQTATTLSRAGVPSAPPRLNAAR